MAQKDADFHALVKVGPNSQLKRLRINKTGAIAKCPALPSTPSDYPYYPKGKGEDGGDPSTMYTCVRGDFAHTATHDAVDLGLSIDQQSEHMALNGAGLTAVPDWFQMTLAQAPTSKAGKFRDPCPTKVVAAANAPGDCMPPLIRFDQPTEAVLFGTFEHAHTDDLNALHNLGPQGTGFTNPHANPDAHPGAHPATVWSDWAPPGGGANDARGLRGLLNLLPSGRSAESFSFRLTLPNSLTFDQLQAWKLEGHDNNPDDKWRVSDIRLHFRVAAQRGYGQRPRRAVAARAGAPRHAHLHRGPH